MEGHHRSQSDIDPKFEIVTQNQVKVIRMIKNKNGRMSLIVLWFQTKTQLILQLNQGLNLESAIRGTC